MRLVETNSIIPSVSQEGSIPPSLYLITKTSIDWNILSSILSFKKLDRQNYSSSEEAAYLASIDLDAKDSIDALNRSNRLNCLFFTFCLTGRNRQFDNFLSELGTSGLGFFIRISDSDNLFIYGTLDKFIDLIISLLRKDRPFLYRYIGNLFYLKLIVLKLEDIFTRHLTKEKLDDGTFILKSR